MRTRVTEQQPFALQIDDRTLHRLLADPEPLGDRLFLRVGHPLRLPPVVDQVNQHRELVYPDLEPGLPAKQGDGEHSIANSHRSLAPLLVEQLHVLGVLLAAAVELHHIVVVITHFFTSWSISSDLQMRQKKP